MRPIEYYLKELLLDYDCVTITGLGGFLTQSRSARLYRDRRRIYPPSRIVHFNSLLVHDDGLLASRVSREESIDYRLAVKRIEEFVFLTRQNLHAGQTVQLDGIGFLTLNPEGNIMFQSFPEMSFDAESFGLESIYVHPFTSRNQAENIHGKKVDRKPRAQKTATPAHVKWTLAVSLPVIAFLLYGIIFPGNYQVLYRNYSSVILDVLRLPDHGSTATIQFENADPAEHMEKEEETPDERSIDPEPPLLVAEHGDDMKSIPGTSIVPDHRYFIIGGCFLNHDNARKFLDDLKIRGFDAGEAGTNQRGQLRISYKSFSDRQEAIVYLEEIKAKENPAAWLLKY